MENKFNRLLFRQLLNELQRLFPTGFMFFYILFGQWPCLNGQKASHPAFIFFPQILSGSYQ
jgi:hypothetical protein